jgi:dihydrodipicolinate synthase/N-acetylneuraminate lyase
MATPIDPSSGRIAGGVIPDLVDFLIGRGVRGVFAGGTTGEGIMMEATERRKLAEAVLAAAAGRVTVLVHVSGRNLEETLELTRHAAAIRADAIAAVTPFFYKIHDDGLFAFYAAIAGVAGDMPLFAYDIPHMAVNGVSPRLAERLVKELPGFAGLKTSNADVHAVRRLRDALPPERIVLVGNESAALGALALGADGLISGLSTAVPEPFVAMTRAFFAGDLAEAQRQQRLINQLLAMLPDGARIAAVKAILSDRGIAAGPSIAPLPQLDRSPWPEMRARLGA